MAELGPNDLLLQIANALTLADELLELEVKNHTGGKIAGVELLKREVEHVLRHARELAGLNPDGSFDQVPPAPKTKRGGR